MPYVVDRMPPVNDSSPRTGVTAHGLVLMSAAALGVQVGLTRYLHPPGQPGLWLAIGLGLLWLVDRRRSRVARGIVIVTSSFGACLYAAGALGDWRAALLALAFAGQALPLLSRPVREHVAERA